MSEPERRGRARPGRGRGRERARARARGRGRARERERGRHILRSMAKALARRVFASSRSAPFAAPRTASTSTVAPRSSAEPEPERRATIRPATTGTRWRLGRRQDTRDPALQASCMPPRHRATLGSSSSLSSPFSLPFPPSSSRPRSCSLPSSSSSSPRTCSSSSLVPRARRRCRRGPPCSPAVLVLALGSSRPQILRKSRKSLNCHPEGRRPEGPHVQRVGSFAALRMTVPLFARGS